MLGNKLKGVRAVAIGVAVVIAASTLAPAVSAQRYEDWHWSGNYQRLSRINAGTYVTVRTTQKISSDRSDDRIYSAVVAEDVWDDYRRLAVPAIPRGSRVELMVRTTRDGDLILDLDSIYAHGEIYAVTARPTRLENERAYRRDDDNTAEMVGGGALLGSVIGAIAGGGKGAAIGAATGAATGLGLSYRGRSVRVPKGSLLTFRLDRGLNIVAGGDRYTRNRPRYRY